MRDNMQQRISGVDEVSLEFCWRCWLIFCFQLSREFAGASVQKHEALSEKVAAASKEDVSLQMVCLGSELVVYLIIATFCSHMMMTSVPAALGFRGHWRILWICMWKVLCVSGRKRSKVLVAPQKTLHLATTAF